MSSSHHERALVEGLASENGAVVERAVVTALESGSESLVAFLLEELVEQCAVAMAYRDLERFVGLGLRVFRAVQATGFADPALEEQSPWVLRLGGQLQGLYRIASSLSNLKLPIEILREVEDSQPLQSTLHFLHGVPRRFSDIQEHLVGKLKKKVNPKSVTQWLNRLIELELVEHLSKRSPYELTFLGKILVYRLDRDPRKIWDRALEVLQTRESAEESSLPPLLDDIISNDNRYKNAPTFAPRNHVASSKPSNTPREGALS